jgi:hypothetical protein
MANPTKLDYRPADTTLTANGQTRTIGGASVTMGGFTLAEQAECQLGDQGNQDSGYSPSGFVDTTYTLTDAQVAKATGMPA